MPDTRDLLNTAAREILIGLVTAITDEKVLNAGAKGTRAKLPYWTTRVTSLGGGRELGQPTKVPGEVEDPDNPGDFLPTSHMEESREASVSIQGYGPTAFGLLDQFRLAADSDGSLALQDTHNVDLVSVTGPIDISTLLDTQEETRCSVDIVLRYDAVQDDATTLIPLEEAQVDLDFDTLPVEFAVDGDGNSIPPT